MVHMMNIFGGRRIPFLFIVDYDGLKPVIIPLREIDPGCILYDIGGVKNHAGAETDGKPVAFRKYPMSFEEYKRAFNLVAEHQQCGDSYLLNLTFPTRVEISLSLRDVFFRSTARFKLWYRDEFVVFSPEPFIKITGRMISAYPMKGTINAAVPDAARIILEDAKEFAEHLTIVDLIRNDLGMVARNIRVEVFRYIEKITTLDSELLQVSSRITGELDGDYRCRIGSILSALLPAGSICGAPKRKTLEIIKEAEKYTRGYYTGVFGYFDGECLESAVMIRYLEKDGSGLVFKSGGGITVYSDAESEYREMIDKVYVPVV